MDFHDNTVFSVNDDCIETDGSGINNRIYNNIFRKFLTGVSVAPAAIGPTYIFRNLFTGWENHSGYDGYPFKFNVNSSLTIDWVYLYHNTCYTDVANQDGFLFKQYSNWNNIISRNNIFAGTDYALDSWSAQNPVDFDYDDLFTTRSGRLASWAGSNYATLAAFSSATGQETHGLNTDPGFANPGSGDYSLGDSSKLIDKGVPIPGINDLFAGNAPDIGCFEHGVSAVKKKAVAGAELSLECSPNPFSPVVVITVRGLPSKKEMELSIYNVQGKLVQKLVAGAAWNAANFPCGIYIVQARTGNTTLSRRLFLAR
jgi:hypothetical protein